MSTIKINTCDKDWFGKDYVFYDKNGNPMNILYDEELDQYKGKLYFDQNGSDTFKTLELNLFERIRGFEYQQYNIGTSSSYDELETFLKDDMKILSRKSNRISTRWSQELLLLMFREY